MQKEEEEEGEEEAHKKRQGKLCREEARMQTKMRRFPFSCAQKVISSPAQVKSWNKQAIRRDAPGNQKKKGYAWCELGGKAP